VCSLSAFSVRFVSSQKLGCPLLFLKLFIIFGVQQYCNFYFNFGTWAGLIIHSLFISSSQLTSRFKESNEEESTVHAGKADLDNVQRYPVSYSLVDWIYSSVRITSYRNVDFPWSGRSKAVREDQLKYSGSIWNETHSRERKSISHWHISPIHYMKHSPRSCFKVLRYEQRDRRRIHSPYKLHQTLELMTYFPPPHSLE
jgi:hypothetical protein